MRYAALIALLAAGAGVSGASAQSLDDVLNGLTMRNIGPFRPSAWVTTIAVPDAPLHDHLYTMWAGTRSGGVWKTTNGGATWDPVFDGMNVAAIGAIALAPSNPNIVWVGTGDQANARSSYSGRGLFKSTDAGRSWSFAGLPDSHHIARIVVHPRDPDIVHVAAMGHLFSRNEERGVLRTTDGGKSWSKVLYVNDQTGAIDLVMNPRNPSVLYAAMYDKQRFPWRLIETGPGSGIYRSRDGGKTWQQLGGGLPTGPLGRIGLTIYPKNPNVLYALVELPAQRGTRNELYRTDDGGNTWAKTGDANVGGGKAPYSFNQLMVDPSNDQRVIVISDAMTVSEDGGRTWDDPRIWPNGFFRRSFGDFRTIWWDQADPQRIILGSDGGVQVSYDGGRTSDYFPNLRVGEAYAVGVDMDDPYHIYGGFQDHDSWKGPVNGRWGVISSIDDWVTVGPGDGMYNVVDPTDSRWVYNTRELNQLGRLDQKTGIRKDIRPPQPANLPRLRYNWIAPIALSPFDPKTLYAGAQYLMRSRDRGDTWEVASPDLTTDDSTKIGFPGTPWATITSISESPLARGTIWIGTDDGKVQLTKDDGRSWTDLTPVLAQAGAPAERWVSRVFASPHDGNTAFVSKNGFRNDDFRPYLYRTTDGGRSWTSLAGNLPDAPINVVVQDRRNPRLLIVGNDLGVYVTIDDGRSWSRLKANLPTVPVHDLTIHPRENDLVLATYGRALWVGDISALQELSPEVLARDLHLFNIEPKRHYGFGTQGMNYLLFSDRYLRVPNEPDGWTIRFYARSASSDSARVTVTDQAGRIVRQASGSVLAGLNRVVIPFGGARGATVTALAAGDYIVTLQVGTERLSKPARLISTSAVGAPPARERPAMVNCPWPVDSAAFQAALVANDTASRRRYPDCAPPGWQQPDSLLRHEPRPLPTDRPRPILDDYLKYVVTAPPPEIVERYRLDTTFYRKYADANGYPILASAKVPDAALAIVRDMVNYMLAHRPDVRDTMIARGARIGIMAETEYTTDLPEQRDWVVPAYLDPRLTPAERARYYEPGGLGSMTPGRYWNDRARGMGGTFTTCAEENVLGYYGTRYWGTNICVHEFSHGIMGAGIAWADPQWYQEIVDAYKAARAKCLVTANGYAGNTFNEYWASGVEWYVGNGGRERAALKAADPVLYELVSRLIPENKVLPQRANVANRTRQQLDEYVQSRNPDWWRREQARVAQQSQANRPAAGAAPSPPCVPQ